MSDTTTTLNPGSGGDVMDESLITQADGVTNAKRARVQIGGSSGTALVDVVSADPGKNPASLPALAVAVVSETPDSGFIDGELRRLSLTTSGRLRVASEAAQTDLDVFGSSARGMRLTAADAFNPFPSEDPFGL